MVFSKEREKEKESDDGDDDGKLIATASRKEKTFKIDAPIKSIIPMRLRITDYTCVARLETISSMYIYTLIHKEASL